MQRIQIFGLMFVLFLTSASQAFSNPKAGFASMELALDQNVSIGGYGYGPRRVNPISKAFSHLFHRSEGTSAPIRVKASVLKEGSQKIAWVSIDVVGITRDFYLDALHDLSSLGYHGKNFFLSATHTHSGPGQLSKNFFWQIAAMDWFNSALYAEILKAVVETVDRADSSAEEAELFSLNTEIKDLQINRRVKGDFVDHQARLILARGLEQKTWLGAIINFAIHGTALGPDNFKFSSDVPGAIEHEIESLLQVDTALLINGIEGDVAPAINGQEGINEISLSFAKQIESAMPLMQPMKLEIKVSEAVVDLPSAILNVHKCESFTLAEFSKLAPLMVKFPAVNVPLSPWVSSKSIISVIQLGDLNMLTWPGEPTGKVGIKLREMAALQGLKDAWINSLTNDYHAYFTDESEYEANTYESCFSLHGKNGANSVLKAFGKLLQRNKTL